MTTTSPRALPARNTADFKPCRRCGEEKPLDSFGANRRTADGRSPWCRDCHAAATRRWREANPDVVARANAARRRHDDVTRFCGSCGAAFTRRPNERRTNCPTCTTERTPTDG